ncbi:MAG: bifunctional phosphoserine phosphatase/homoserine phosphotransferase ThrH [Myxococcales bacterium]|nr:bifunctional phosphoserine phosphatase/homoserine phosphotransferase ThrH [Myxococcales bacterium]
MRIVCLDLEGVLIPEVWINVAERTGIEELRLTTRDIPDYDELMTRRLGILDEHGLGLPRIQEVIDTMEPLPGARAFIDGLRAEYQVVILSDTFYEFAEPFMRKLGWPTLFCHSLEVDASGRITAYRLRQEDPKRKAVQALKGLNFRTVASGDSYNDTTMLEEADAGILFRAPDNVIEEFPQFPHVQEYADLDAEIRKAFEQIAATS